MTHEYNNRIFTLFLLECSKQNTNFPCKMRASLESSLRVWSEYRCLETNFWQFFADRQKFIDNFRWKGLIHRAVPPSNFECCPTFSYFFSSSLLLIKELRLSSRAAFSILGEKEDSWKKMTVSLRNAVIRHVNAVSIGDVRNCVVLFLPREE